MPSGKKQVLYNYVRKNCKFQLRLALKDYQNKPVNIRLGGRTVNLLLQSGMLSFLSSTPQF